MTYDIEIRVIQPRPIASSRATTTPEQVGSVLTQTLLPGVYAFIQARGLAVNGPPVAVYHRFEPDQVELEAGVPVAAEFEGDDRVQRSVIPGGSVAATRHVGPYEGLGAAYTALRQWIADHGYQIVGPAWESYPMPPGGEPDPARLTTDVFWLVAPHPSPPVSPSR